MTFIKDNKNWQVSLSDPRNIVEGEDDIIQCIYIILTTVKGSDPLRPDFGSDLYKYLDKPLQANYARMVNEAVTAISKWEKRIRVKKCTVEDTATGKRNFNIRAERISDIEQFTAKIEI